MQQQYQPAYQQHQVMPQNLEYKMMMPQQTGGKFYEIAQEPSIIFKKDPKCLCCYPSFTFNKTFMDRDVGEKIYKMKPTSNCFCCCYEAKIQSKAGDTLLTSKRPLCNQALLSFLGYALCSCCCLTRYNTKGDHIKGKSRWPCCCKNLCCQYGYYVDINDKEKFWIGQDKKECCCGGEVLNIEDIWNSERTIRLGSIYHILRADCCLCLVPLALCLKFLCCVKRWKKISFPKNATEEEKGMIMASVSNGSGECTSCCIPYQ